jgi:hypothetical protein
MLTCNESEEVDAEDGEDLDLCLLVHVGVHRDGVVQQQRGPAHLTKQTNFIDSFCIYFRRTDLEHIHIHPSTISKQ